ncbi:MAG: tetratricopeptide repeat protein [Mesorhizobium sp.]|nr:tetratricopeptide repeat protein [Mesorhizobium sp.]MBL8577388.1 tetratricopeptide repeat protein [Mesorhizobium sp.]
MRQKGRRWLLGLAAATGLMVSVSGQAARAAQSAEPIEVNSFAGAYLAGRVAEVDNKLSDAIVYYKKALSFAPDNDALRQSLMLALLSEGRFDEAVPQAEKLRSVPEVERLAGLTLAIDSFHKKNYQAAQTQLTFAEESDLDSLISGIVIAWAKLGAGDKDGAIAAMDGLSGPDWYGLFVSYAKALIADQAGKKDIADRSYRAALDDVANGGAAPDAWLRAAESYAGFLARQGKKDEALAVLEKADEFASGRLPILSLRDRIMKGDTIAPIVATPSEGASEHLMVLASALNRGGGEPFVRLYLQLALALRPDSDQTLIQLAGVAEQQQDSEAAIALYERIPASSPLKRVSQLQLGLNLADLDRRDEAIAQLKKLVDENPEDMRGYLALGGVYASKEDYAEAAKTYDRAVERLETKKGFVMPKDPRAASNWNIYYQRGIAYERLKQWPKAEPNFRKALELFPNQPQVMNYLGYSWIDMNINLQEGMDMIAKAVELRPSDGYIVDSLGWAHYRLGDYDAAVRELERAVSLMPNDPVLNDHLGDAYWRVGRKLEATFQWSHARDMKPEPAVLAEVEKKLKEGLPPVEARAVAGQTEVTPAPPAVEPEPAKPEQRSDAGPAVAPSAIAEPAAYKVSRGQSLWSIAADELGNGSRYIEILNLNPQLRGDPGRLVPGQELKLPPAGN